MTTSRSRLRLAVLAATCIAAVAGLSAGPAAGTYKGINGPIAFALNGDIYTIAPNGSGLHNVTHAKDSSEAQPAISPNGRGVAFEISIAGRTAEIFTSDLNGKHPRWITQKPSKSGKFLSFHGPTWSPNGKRIAFVCNSFSRHEICSMDAAGKKIKYLTHCDCAYAEPDWSTKNGIVFNGGTKLYTVSGNGGAAKQLPISHLDSLDSVGYDHPSWSPDGSTIAFSVGSANTAIDLVDANGGNHRRIIQSQDFGNDPTDYDYPSWAPDGTTLAIHVSGNGPSQGGKPEGLYTITPDGGNLTPVSSKVVGQYVELSWGPKKR
jgi:Tol biopolymer transport system component